MCFTPAISLTTSFIEFVIATYILIYFKKSLINRFFAFFIYLLGAYQFSEFMLCVSSNPLLWAKIGFIVYTFLPAVGLCFGLQISGKWEKGWLLYLIPISFSLFAIFSKEFIISAVCNNFFVTVKNILFSTFLLYIYWIYYFGFIFLFILFIGLKIKKERKRKMRIIEVVVLLAIVASLGGALVFIITIPALNIMFPSVYCEFAILFSIAGLITSYINEKR